MADKIQSIRGMNDLLPKQSASWLWVENKIINVLERYGYQQIRFPIVEKTELFCRSIGEVTDIVEKEMYSFRDRSDEPITLRPEGTAGCVRAVMQHNLAETPQRLWYQGAMFRYERPQKGRLRQFHQFGVEIFGIDSADIDAELIAMTAQFWKELGISEYLTLQINSLGTADSRAKHKQALLDYLKQHFDVLDEDSQRRFESNPLRILDSKNPQTQAIVKDAPMLMDFLSDDEMLHFQQLKQLLDFLGVAYEVNTNLVRGLDYYTHTVFEWVTTHLGAQGTVCGGGRYNGLAQQLGSKKPIPGLGFGMGIERLMLLIESCNPKELEQTPNLDIYLVVEQEVIEQGLALAQSMRIDMPMLRVQTHCGGGSIKSQMKKADKSGARWALILGVNEVANDRLTLKQLRVDEQWLMGQQVTLNYTGLLEYLT